MEPPPIPFPPPTTSANSPPSRYRTRPIYFANPRSPFFFLLGVGLALSTGTVPLLVLAPAPTLLTQWRAMYDMGLWIGPPGAVIGAASLGYAAWATYAWEKGEKGARGGDGAEGDGAGESGMIREEERGGGKWKPLALAAGSCVAIVPFTWAFLVGTSEVLLRECEGGVGAGMSEGLLRDTAVKWGWICAARALLPLVGTVAGVWSVLGW